LGLIGAGDSRNWTFCVTVLRLGGWLSWGRSAGFADEAAQLVASLDPGFGVDVEQVVFDGLGRNEQRSGYLGVGHSPCVIR
jgi:hypothetical protein